MSEFIDHPVKNLSSAGGCRKIQSIIAEDPEWTLVLVPTLSNLCLQTIVRHFEEKPIIEELLPIHKEYVLERLPTSLPLHVIANLLSDEGYWKRRCQERWSLCDVSHYGNSWKRMFFERHVENMIELFTPDATDPQAILDMVPLCQNYVKRLEISQLLPPIKDPQNSPDKEEATQEKDVLDLESLTSDVPSMDHFDFGILLDKLNNLEELHLVYRVKSCGMNFEPNLFEFTLRDCDSLAKALKSCKTLKVLRLHQSKVEDKRCRLLVSYLLDHPSLKELDLSHNLIGDRGARAIGKLLNRSKLEILNISNNNIRGPGGRAIAHSLSKNSTLLSLNLCLNRLRDEGGQAIGQALLKNYTMLHLHLGSNDMTETAATILSQVLAQNNTLRSINLTCNRLGPDGGTILEEGMSLNESVLECDIRLTEVDQESSYNIGIMVRNNQDRARRKLTQKNTTK